MKHHRILAIALIASVVAFGGCRNPFNPSARVRFDRFYAGIDSLPILTIQQSAAGTMSNSITNLPQLLTVAAISNTSTVPAKITGYNVVYRELSTGLPIASCGGAGGRRFSALINVPFLLNNYYPAASTGAPIMIVTNELLTHIATNLTTLNGGIDCEVTFYGEDENGYDIQVDGVLHIDVL